MSPQPTNVRESGYMAKGAEWVNFYLTSVKCSTKIVANGYLPTICTNDDDDTLRQSNFNIACGALLVWKFLRFITNKAYCICTICFYRQPTKSLFVTTTVLYNLSVLVLRNYGLNSFSYNGARLWNNLSNDFKIKSKVKTFKSLLGKWHGLLCPCSCCTMCILRRLRVFTIFFHCI